MFKKSSGLLLIAITALAVQAQTNLAIVKGRFEGEKITEAVLYKVHEGAPLALATLRMQENGEFAFALPNATEGFYYLSNQARRSFVRIYLKPTDHLELLIDEHEKMTQLKGSAENKIQAQWSGIANDYLRKGTLFSKDTTTYKSFFPMLAAFQPKAAGFAKAVNTPNKTFNTLMKLAVQQDVASTAFSFLMLPNSIHPGTEETQLYYRDLMQHEYFTDGRLLKLGETRRFATSYPSVYYRLSMEPEALQTFMKSQKGKVIGLDMMQNDTLKGLLVVNALNRYRTFDEMEAAIAPYKQYLVTDSLKSAYFMALKSVASFKKGNPSYNFSYEDPSGKKVSMSDLKGKVVMIDVWATWCGPCKAEIPALKALEKDMHGMDVAFVSVSVDEEKDKEKWKNFVDKEQLGGVQLYAKGWSDIAKYYDIKGIPRFMVFDKEGKIVTTDAPRPSSPELRQLLFETLNTPTTTAGQ